MIRYGLFFFIIIIKYFLRKHYILFLVTSAKTRALCSGTYVSGPHITQNVEGDGPADPIRVVYRIARPPARVVFGERISPVFPIAVREDCARTRTGLIDGDKRRVKTRSLDAFTAQCAM